MISETAISLYTIPPGSPYCSDCNIKNNCPSTDTGPEEPILEQYAGYYTEVSTIGDFTLDEFAHMTCEEFLEMGYANEMVMEYFFRLQETIRTLICMEA